MEEGFGRATGDVKAQVEGKAEQAEDAVQDAYGQVKETASDAVEAIRESASGAQDFLRTTIEERPYTAAAVALGGVARVCDELQFMENKSRNDEPAFHETGLANIGDAAIDQHARIENFRD